MLKIVLKIKKEWEGVAGGIFGSLGTLRDPADVEIAALERQGIRQLDADRIARSVRDLHREA